MKTILVVGGSGAQGVVTRDLAKSGEYRVLLFTRDTVSIHSTELLSLPNVEPVINTASSGYDLAAFEAAAKQSYGLFLNTDGFALGEKSETYWGIRLYEVALKAGVRHVVYSGLDNHYRDSNYNPDFYIGHFQGKARVQDWIRSQPTSTTSWTIIKTGPYVDMLTEALLPQAGEDGTYNFKFPLDDGAIVFIALDDFAQYIKWIFDNPERTAGLDLGIAIEHSTGESIAAAFTATTGKPAKYENITASEWTGKRMGGLPNGADTKVGFKSTTDQSSLGQTFEENFNNFWNLWKSSKTLVKRDYKLLDEILPGRIRSVQEWMERTKYTGAHQPLLKTQRK